MGTRQSARALSHRRCLSSGDLNSGRAGCLPRSALLSPGITLTVGLLLQDPAGPGPPAPELSCPRHSRSTAAVLCYSSHWGQTSGLSELCLSDAFTEICSTCLHLVIFASVFCSCKFRSPPRHPGCLGVSAAGSVRSCGGFCLSSIGV